MTVAVRTAMRRRKGTSRRSLMRMPPRRSRAPGLEAGVYVGSRRTSSMGALLRRFGGKREPRGLLGPRPPNPAILSLHGTPLPRAPRRSLERGLHVHQASLGLDARGAHPRGREAHLP